MKKNKHGNNIFQAIFLPIMLAVFKTTAGLYISKILFKVKVTGVKLRDIKGSYILLGNHVTNYDGLFFQQHASQIISFIANERLFRIKFLGPLMRWTHLIPKKKFSKDIQAVRHLFAAKNEGRIIGIFPEGRRCWDGCITPIIDSIASLAKSLKLPVVVGLLKGAYTCEPRWNDGLRKGNVIADYQMILTEQDVRKLSTEEILDAITKGLDYKEHEYLKENRTFFRSKSPALGLERLLYICPQCMHIGTITSSNYLVKCTCGMIAEYDNYGELKSKYFDNLQEWNIWQRVELSAQKYMKSTDVIFEDHNVTLSTVPSNSYDQFQSVDLGCAKVYRDRIVFEGKKTYQFDINELWGCNIQKNYCFEFNEFKTGYMFSFSGYDSAYKWSSYMEL
ncbi:MAG: 1-acyl-sn-glycerol-3-phosphate acyltransferase [Clostridiales bacterium]|nr:1-acyl-sn-glycerol-3-phosphate acyltransferase [Clostridiales bacterium]